MSQNIVLKFEGNNHEDHLVLCVSWGRIPFHELLELDVYQHSARIISVIMILLPLKNIILILECSIN